MERRKSTNDETASTESNESKRLDIPRRRFIQAAGAGLIGFGTPTGWTGTAAGRPAMAEDAVAEYTNLRVQEARKAWQRGFRGQADRTLAMIGPGLESRHPDLGPWNGVRAVPDGAGGLTLVRENYERLDVDYEQRSDTGSFGPNAGDARNDHPFTAPADADRVEAHVFAVPPFVTGQLRLVLETADGTTIDSFQSRTPHSAVEGTIAPGNEYVLAVETTANGNPVVPSYDISWSFLADNPDTDVSDPFADIDPSNVTADTPKVVGWYNEEAVVSETTVDPRGGPRIPPRGTKGFSIMAGSGRASAIDGGTVREATPETVLGPGESLTYPVEVRAGRGVFGSAFGENIEVHVHGPDGTHITEGGPLSDSGYNGTNVKVSTPTVHASGTATYTIEIVPNNFFPTRSRDRLARVERVTVGVFEPHDETAGDRTGDGFPSLHGGIAPNAGLVGLSGYVQTRDRMAELAEDFVETFNLRALYVDVFFDPSSGVAAGTLSNVEVIKTLANAGVLTVSLTDTTPASSPDRESAVADESIMVVSAGPNDGIWSETVSEPVAVDEDGEGPYLKPDVVAPGGKVTERSMSAKPGEPFRVQDDDYSIRDYSPSGLAMQAPFVAGTAGLVAQALEEAAPKAIALPPPADTSFRDVMRLKSTILSTASETAFTAAPWHKRQPTYDFGGHDPVEGWGRVNVDAAVEAASRDLTPPAARSASGSGSGRSGSGSGRSGSNGDSAGDSAGTGGTSGGQSGPGGTGGNSTGTVDSTGTAANSRSIADSMGLDVPRHSRAVAGYVSATPGRYRVDLTFSEYTGEDATSDAAPPHVDLFVYDAENPGSHGTPNIVARATTVAGSASLEFAAGTGAGGSRTGGTYYVVAKLVNVPGAVNSHDVKVHVELSVERSSPG